MPPTDTPLASFGAMLRRERKQAGLTLEILAQQVRESGYEVTAANIGAWERGEYAPKTREPIALIEDILGITDGRLHEAMGWRRGDGNDKPPWDQMLASLDRLIDEVRDFRQEMQQTYPPGED